jgi:hypothetical protein
MLSEAEINTGELGPFIAKMGFWQCEAFKEALKVAPVTQFTATERRGVLWKLFFS